MRNGLIWPTPFLLPLLFVTATVAQKPAREPIHLPTSKVLSNVPSGRLAFVNSFPATIAVSPDGNYAALLNDGYGTQDSRGYQSITILDFRTNQVADFPDERLGPDAHQSYFQGLVFSSDGKHLYASIGSITDPTGVRPGNTGNGIAAYTFADGKLSSEKFIRIGPQQVAAGKRIAAGLFKVGPGRAIPYPAGLAVIRAGSGDQLLVANNYADNVILLDPASGKILKTFDLSTKALIPSAFPYAVVASRDGKRAWCSLWNASQVVELDLQGKTRVRPTITISQPSSTAPGAHPTAMLLSSDEKVLYIALSNADKVLAVSTDRSQPNRVLNTNVPGSKAGGTVPDALALSSDGKRLFVADAGINAIAVFDLSAPAKTANLSPSGFIPTDWYPSALAVHSDDLFIATAKGQGTGPNDGANQITEPHRHRQHPYIVTLLRGSLARIDLKSTEPKLADLTREVQADNLFLSDPGKIVFRRGNNPIKHVIYVLKENRTYDQVLGDVKAGNGDSSLTMYGEDITPNEHKLALQFGVLDNFYDSGEVSGDGHVWSTAAITSDYNERTWQIAYRGKERTYDYQGTVADEYAIEHDEPDVDDPGTGFLWGNLAKHGLTYRIYGEFINGEWCAPEQSGTPKQGPPRTTARCSRDFVHRGEPLPANVGQPHGSPSPWPWPVPLVQRMVATKPELRDHFDPLYPDFNTSYPDQLRVDEFLNEFDRFVEARKQGKGTELPQFVLLYLPDDHTAGRKPGAPQPIASVADNDLALGRVVDAVSHSPYWDDTAILVLEDDAQDGVDHVDAHRSIAFVISKYSPGSVQQPFVAHEFYTTVNMIHTIESLLDLPPMNLNDAYAPVMAPLFSGDGSQPPFVADFRNRDNGMIYRVNPRHGPDAAASSRLDFSRPDAADAALLNGILWRDRMGATPMPASRHNLFPH
jgi:DNA-binding beta-propeller fold protein YncE